MDCLLPSGNLKILIKAIHAMARMPGEDMYIEAATDGLKMRTVNSSRSAYLCFHFKEQFFISYMRAVPNENNESRREGDDDRTTGNYCKISMKSALIIYKAALTFEKSIDTCGLSVDVDNWKLVLEFRCKSGVIRRYRLNLLTCSSVHALFDKSLFPNAVTVPGKLFVDGVGQNFHSNQGEATMIIDGDSFDLRSYVEDAPQPTKVVKTQLHLERVEFEHFSVRNNAEITFCLKELRAFLLFIETYQLAIVIRSEGGGKPILFSVESDPAFVGDLVLATFIEADTDKTQPINQDQPAVQQENQEQTRSLRQNNTQPIDAQPIVHMDSEDTLPLYDDQGRIITLPRRVSINAGEVMFSSDQSIRNSGPAPPKKVRTNLFADFLEASSIIGSQVCMEEDGENDQGRVLLAPDSDLEDY